VHAANINFAKIFHPRDNVARVDGKLTKRQQLFIDEIVCR
jgi:hypothetical protein